MKKPTRSIVKGTEGKNEKTVVSVEFYKIAGGGYTWPWSRQHLLVRFIEQPIQDIDWSGNIWEFFSKHSKN